MPSCLIELGFITTSDEEQLLNSERGIENHARGIYRAFNRYKRKYDDNIVVPYNAPKKKERVEIPTIVPPEIKEESQPKTKPQPQVEEKVPENVTVAEASPAPEPVRSEVEPLPVEEAKVAPVFKVQILATDYQLKKNDSQLKGEKDVDLYQEKGWFKYTIGASSDYQEINQLRKTLQAKFPQAFIVAFKNGAKMDVREAIQEYKKMSGKK